MQGFLENERQSFSHPIATAKELSPQMHSDTFHFYKSLSRSHSMRPGAQWGEQVKMIGLRVSPIAYPRDPRPKTEFTDRKPGASLATHFEPDCRFDRSITCSDISSVSSNREPARKADKREHCNGPILACPQTPLNSDGTSYFRKIFIVHLTLSLAWLTFGVGRWQGLQEKARLWRYGLLKGTHVQSVLQRSQRRTSSQNPVLCHFQSRTTSPIYSDLVFLQEESLRKAHCLLLLGSATESKSNQPINHPCN